MHFLCTLFGMSHLPIITTTVASITLTVLICCHGAVASADLEHILSRFFRSSFATAGHTNACSCVWRLMRFGLSAWYYRMDGSCSRIWTPAPSWACRMPYDHKSPFLLVQEDAIASFSVLSISYLYNYGARWCWSVSIRFVLVGFGSTRSITLQFGKLLPRDC